MELMQEMSGLGVERPVKGDEYATELHLAVKENDVPGIRKLLEGGAKVTAPDKFGRTPLHWALVYDHLEAARALILNMNKRALDSRDSCGCTVLHYAALGGRTEVGRILIERGAHVNSVDSRKRTPLHFAAQHPNPFMVEMLISRGADRSCRDIREYLPCDVALEWASFSSLACLRPDGQKKDPKLKVHPIEIMDEQEDRGGAREELTVRRSPSLDKLLESWKKAENEARRGKETESQVASKAFSELQRTLEEWRAAEQDARLRERGETSPVFVDDDGNDALLQVKEMVLPAALYPTDEHSTSGSSSLPSSSHLNAIRDSSSSAECRGDELYSPPSSSSSYSMSSSSPGRPASRRDVHEWLDASEKSRRGSGTEALLWCTEWDVEIPGRSAGKRHVSDGDAIHSFPTFPGERKREGKAVSEEEPLWLQVWPKPFSFPSGITPRPKTVYAMC